MRIQIIITIFLVDVARSKWWTTSITQEVTEDDVGMAFPVI